MISPGGAGIKATSGRGAGPAPRPSPEDGRGGRRRRIVVVERSSRVRFVWLTVVLLGGACGGSLSPRDAAPPFDAFNDVPNCYVTGPGAPTLCNVECNSPCGCASCTPGERQGIYTCTLGGCYDLVETDAGVDAGWTPSPACALPFDPGPCDAAFPVYAFANGVCVAQVYGGCEGNGNRFSTREECMAACEGRPYPYGCPAGRIARAICFACGAAGGCARSAPACALPCDQNADAAVCEDTFFSCSGGVCQIGLCF